MQTTKLTTKEEVISYINTLKWYQGYVQFSHRAIDIDKDLFIDNQPKVENEDGFIYEAHFANAENSIQIRQINNNWIADVTDIANAPTETFYAIKGFKVKMAQIWAKEKDDLCEGMEVEKLKKVVFAGIEKGGKQ